MFRIRAIRDHFITGDYDIILLQVKYLSFKGTDHFFILRLKVVCMPRIISRFKHYDQIRF